MAFAEDDRFGEPRAERLQLVQKLHGMFEAKVSRGVSPNSVVNQLEAVRRFFVWIDSADADVSGDGAIDAFRRWTDDLLHRSNVVKELSRDSAYDYASVVADALARALDIAKSKRSTALMRLAAVRRPPQKKRVLGTNADKQNLADTFTFGHALADICSALDGAAIRGPLPVVLALGEGRTVTLACGLKSLEPPSADKRSRLQRDDAVRTRAPLPADLSPSESLNRSPLLNLRIDAELLIFVAQTGMNLAQAAQLRREDYRWKSDGDDALAFRVHKGRRGGEAIFRCFKAYRTHLKKYLAWLDDMGFKESDQRLFPYLYPSRIPPEHRGPSFFRARRACAELGLKYFGPRSLRSTRINWLLRRSQDPDRTAQQAANNKETLLRNYEQAHHQVAAAQIIRFHLATDPAVAPPGPGLCVTDGGGAIPLSDVPAEAPPPDCVSPEGCLFCLQHRDVMSADYCWKLASHARLKSLEVSLFRPASNQAIHPANRVIERISEKLRAIASESEEAAQWVRDAGDHVRAGRFHPAWDVFIRLAEGL